MLGAVIVSGSDGSGTFVASLANKGLDKAVTLTSVTGPQGLEVQLTAPVEVPAAGLVNLADKGAVRVAGDAVTYGAYLRLTLAFDDGESTKVNVPVVAREGEYGDVAPALPAPSGGASPSSSASLVGQPVGQPLGHRDPLILGPYPRNVALFRDIPSCPAERGSTGD